MAADAIMKRMESFCEYMQEVLDEHLTRDLAEIRKWLSPSGSIRPGPP